MLTSKKPKPHAVLQPNSTPTLPRIRCRATVPSREQREMQLKFFIGLRLLGEKKAQRYLAHLATLQESGMHGKSEEDTHGV